MRQGKVEGEARTEKKSSARARERSKREAERKR